MERYEFSNESRELLEKSVIPFAIYQFVDKRVVALIISDGFCKLFHYDNREEAYYDMNHNMYAEAYPGTVVKNGDVYELYWTNPNADSPAMSTATISGDTMVIELKDNIQVTFKAK